MKKKKNCRHKGGKHFINAPRKVISLTPRKVISFTLLSEVNSSSPTHLCYLIYNLQARYESTASSIDNDHFQLLKSFIVGYYGRESY